MMHLAIWLKKNGFRADQVQTFYPSPMATATTMYYSGKNPLAKVARYTENVDIVKVKNKATLKLPLIKERKGRKENINLHVRRTRLLRAIQ